MKQTGASRENPRCAGFSLSVGKHVVKRYPSKIGKADLCCKTAYLRDNGRFSKRIIKAYSGIVVLRWHKQRIRPQEPCS